MPMLTIRLDNALLDLVRVAAASRRKSMQAWALEAMRMQVTHQARSARGAALAALLDQAAGKKNPIRPDNGA